MSTTSLPQRLPRALQLVLVLPLLGACGNAGAADRPSWQAAYDTIGDTIIVHTVSGSVWGDTAELVPELTIGEFDGADEYMFGQVQSLAVAGDGTIYLYDSHAKALRKYAPDGTYLATLGREGGGPGEYQRPDGGLRVLPDGRVALRDPGNARINIYSPEGESVATIPIRGNFNTSRQMGMDTAGNLYHTILLDPEAEVTEWRTGLVRISPAGEELDTLEVPDRGFEGPRIEAKTESSWSINTVPFSPSEEWQLHPHGWFLHGISDRYAVDLLRPEGILRISREAAPIPVAPGEKTNAEERAAWSMRQTEPGWKWNGPAIPDVKPPYRGLNVGEDGRIWVLRSQPGERIPDDQVDQTRDPDARPPQRWREPVVFDVFQPDGVYLGSARAPAGFSTHPTPVFRGDEVWAVVRDAMDVPYVTRFRVRVGGAAELDDEGRGP